ncbi:MAG: hypothetical protein NC920_02945, partial [Candidatus Omnitrophica bacterium]|nr:hypothetical protein [Candidatus Omnitrophota bacterium]
IKISDGEYFDAEYGLFYEDLDLNWRANRFGWRAYYNPKAIAYHLRGSSVRLNKPAFSLFRYFQFCCLSPEHKLMLFKNRYATLIKNETLITFLRNFFFVFLYDFCLWFYIFLFEPNLVLKFSKEVKFLYSSFKKRR